MSLFDLLSAEGIRILERAAETGGDQGVSCFSILDAVVELAPHLFGPTSCAQIRLDLKHNFLAGQAHSDGMVFSPDGKIALELALTFANGRAGACDLLRALLDPRFETAQILQRAGIN